MLKVILLLGTGLLCASAVHAHEYWLDPINPILAPNDDALIDIRNGENFKGAAYPLDNSRVKSIVISSQVGAKRYQGRLGDYPAIHPTLSEEGLHSVSIETNSQPLTYNSWEKFTNFLDYHGFADIAERHLQRKLPKTEITENYFRAAKTFVYVGDLEDSIGSAENSNTVNPTKALAPVGAPLEMLLLESPFKKSKSIEIKLIFDGKPLANRQTEMFWKGPETIRTTATTDSNGIAKFKLHGGGEYLFNAVQLSEAKNKDVHWISHWASITFER